MKGVSAVIATILILMITVSLAASAYIFFSSTLSATQQTGEKQIASTTQKLSTQFNVESVKGNTIYVRNNGIGDLANLTVFVDNVLVNTSMSPIKSGGTGSVTVSSFIDYSSAKSMKVGAGALFNSLTLTSLQGYDNLAAHWKFDEPAGAIYFADSSGNNFQGSCFSSQYCPASGATGKVNKAANFDKVDDYIQVSDSSVLQLTNRGSIEAWIYKNQNGGGIVSKTSGSGYYLIDQGGQIVFGWLYSAATSNQVVPTGSWNHIAATYDGAQLKVYINGYLDKTQSYIGSASSTGAMLYIGMTTAGTRYGGLIDELRIWNRTLSGDEIEAHYLDGK